MSKQFNNNNSSFSFSSSKSSQNAYQQEWYESEVEDFENNTFIENMKEFFGKTFDGAVTLEEFRKFLDNHFDDYCTRTFIERTVKREYQPKDWQYDLVYPKEDTYTLIDNYFRAGNQLKAAWAMLPKPENEDETEAQKYFMNYWTYAFMRYERDKDEHKVPTMTLFKRAIKVGNETSFYLGEWAYHFLSMTKDINILSHRVKLIDQCHVHFVDFFQKGYFKSLSRRTFLSLPRFHDWLRGAKDLFLYVKSCENMPEKDIRLLGHVSSNCREYVISRMKKEQQENFNEFNYVKGSVEQYVLEWQNFPKFRKNMVEQPGKRQWKDFLNKFQENVFMDEYPNVDLKPLALAGLGKQFLALLKRHNRNYGEHTVKACRDLFIAMGRQATRYFDKWFKDASEHYYAVHDAGQPFYNGQALSKEWQDFIMRYGPEAARMSKFSDKIKFPTSLNEVRSLVANMAYGSGPEDVQRACYECHLSEEEFKDYLVWLEDHINKDFESCPVVDIEIEGYRFHKLAFNDARGPLLGLYTNCCQHPNGAGSDCAEHGWMSGYGAFYVIEHKGKIVGQSWAWRGGKGDKPLNTLCFDNIELLSDAYGPSVLKLYQEAARRFLGWLGIERVTVGLGYNDLAELNSLKYDRYNAEPYKYDGYRDSHRQKILYTMLEE